MKKIISLLLTIALLITLSGCADATELISGAYFLFLVATGDDRPEKEDIFEFVQENEQALLNAIEENDYSLFEDNEVIKSIDVDKTVVDFYCGGAGIGSGTSYVGFYYTPDNDMTAVWCAPSSDLLEVCGNGFQWREEKGDNRYYTEKICECFFYYEASF